MTDIQHTVIGQDRYRTILDATFDLGMFKVDFEDPFELTGGGSSPVYIDARQWTKDADLADEFVYALDDVVTQAGIDYDWIGSGVTAGVPYGERFAHHRHEPSIYVRDEPKGYGRDAQIEGAEAEEIDGETVLLVEDLITDGGSKHEFIDGIEQAGGTVNHCISFYDRQQGGRASLAGRNVDLLSVVPIDVLMEHGRETGRLDDRTYQRLGTYLAGER
ncbi:MAG: hypothetical protein SVW77_00120 [Candidatus Nanohaloarchaea archaeon]|nr:hypothetical protein [Candidatus Nanohaloarchaea archaeon]